MDVIGKILGQNKKMREMPFEERQFMEEDIGLGSTGDDLIQASDRGYALNMYGNLRVGQSINVKGAGKLKRIR